MSTSPKRGATGRINVSNYDAKPVDDAGAFTIAEVSITEEFEGDLVGIGSARIVMVTEAGGGTAHFAGMERFGFFKGADRFVHLREFRTVERWYAGIDVACDCGIGDRSACRIAR